MKQYFRLKTKIIQKSVGSYLLPGLFLLATLAIGVAVAASFQEIVANYGTDISFALGMLSIVSGVGIGISLATVCYFIQLVYYDDHRYGIEYIVYSKPLSRKQIFFGNLLAILIPVFVTALVYWIIGTTTIAILFSRWNFGTLAKGSAFVLFTLITGTMLIFAIGMTIAPKINHKAFGAVMTVPLVFGAIIMTINSVEYNMVGLRKFSKSYVNTEARENQILSTSNSLLDFNGDKIDSFLAKRGLNSTATSFDRFAPITNNNHETTGFYSGLENQATLISSYLRWSSIFLNNIDVISAFINQQVEANTKIAYKKRQLNTSDYLNLKSADARNYSLIQTGAASEADFKKIIREKVIPRLSEKIDFTQREINSASPAEKQALQKVKNQYEKALGILKGVNKYSDIFNLDEFKTLIQSSYEKIKDLSPNLRDGNFLQTHQAILNEIINANGTYKENESFYEYIISRESLATYLTAHYYQANNIAIKDLKSVHDKNTTPGDIENLRRISQIHGLKSNDNKKLPYELIKYELIESDYFGIKEMKVSTYNPTWLAFSIQIVATILLFVAAYYIHKRKGLK